VVVYRDDAITASDPGVTRPDYERLCDDIRGGLITAVVANEQSRLTRQPREWDEFQVMLALAGLTKVHTVSDGIIDFEVDGGMSDIRAIFNRKEVKRIRKRFKGMHATLAREGRFSGGHTPYGYSYGKGEDGRAVLTVQEAEAAVIHRMADMTLQGFSTGAIARRLKDDGVPTPRRAARWRTETVRSVLLCPTLAGLRGHNGSTTKARWEAIRPRPTWEAVRGRLTGQVVVNGSDGAEHVVTRKHSAARTYLLTGGLAVCGRCGANMQAGASTRRGGGSVKAYRCGGCGLTVSPAARVEEHVVNEVLAALDTPASPPSSSPRTARTTSARRP
jgi:DNA invertase Pin-like site-specific DNA recombinase